MPSTSLDMKCLSASVSGRGYVVAKYQLVMLGLESSDGSASDGCAASLPVQPMLVLPHICSAALMAPLTVRWYDATKLPSLAKTMAAVPR